MNILDGASVLPAGDAAVVLQFGDAIDPAVHDRVVAVDRAIRRAALSVVEEAVPSYRSVLVRFDPLATSPAEVVRALGALQADVGSRAAGHAEVEVSFAAADAPDLDDVAQRAGRTAAEVVDALTSRELRVYLHGFAPGFAYLGGVPSELHLPRRATPRSPVPAGSVLLAAGQVALCPVSMPTGWWVVGRTDATLFDPTTDPPVPFLPGDTVRLVGTS